MVLGLIKKIVGTRNDRELKRIQSYVDRINALEPDIQKLTDDQLKAKTPEFKERFKGGESLDELLPEAFAVCREASIRTLEMRHFDVQLVGGVALHEGKIAEMRTGEGKTLVATLPVYLNSLTGKGVHVVTVNEYLAQRDSDWMGQIYRFLGLSVGTIVHAMSEEERQKAYESDVTYGTNNEFGFDYLRDNMKIDAGDFVQGNLNFAIVDEVDSILIDEARTPLIISGPAEESTDKYYTANRIIPKLKKEEHYTIDEKARSSSLTEEGVSLVEKLLNVPNLYDPVHIETLHHVQQALKAHAVFKKDVDYVIKDGKVVIIDEFTGRTMEGRRYSDGLHQALEAKEGVNIENENQTLASITFQNYFRMYDKLAGMTGTADTEAEEFQAIYGLEVLVIPTNMPMIREDHADLIYRTEKEKFDAVIEEIRELNQVGRPVLVGTISIEKSEQLSKYLKKFGIQHNVLNAKQHAREAEIVAQAGQRGAVTIATNMAGRGTDIVLGEGVPDLGGLHILGTERHESRRIDNQLRGRSGRQGDNGSSRFYLSLEDDLLRIFGSDRISGLMARLGMENGQPIEHAMVSKAVENAQRKVEAHNYDIRKHLLEYDDVMNRQREVIYSLRKDVLTGTNQKELLYEMADEVLDSVLAQIAPPEIYPEEWDIEQLNENLKQLFNLTIVKVDDHHLRLEDKTEITLQDCKADHLHEEIFKAATAKYDLKEKEIGGEFLRYPERMIMLQVLDNLWKDHLLSMDHLKQGIGLQSYAQKNPLNEYKKIGFQIFEGMIFRMKEEICAFLFKAQINRDAVESLEVQQAKEQRKVTEHRGEASEGPKQETVRRDAEKVGRNDPCPCGSGKKYKKCHGQ
ncbi:MAG: preprotein translocase subunit SecA [Nitrospinaceae bacterium]|nr:preprotein translocase subunit SecA [Nitrospinaceae bacterium]NIR57257.1 preprotein translocase subunit SecA [Nitrospinaceae bacterium]NIS87705.1 preprotein translocase subunit SecA [Nitrospinaceae bacterium]NIT84571.1 preprotein translocase subunit SecA [Nitrospinaceae bacterium]NIU46757.1 preprotein translocase subunit SecA [Nitrospinaceae bacterium]